MSNRLIYADKAEQDLTNIALYIAKDNVDRAISFTAELKKDMELLLDNPLMGVAPKHYTIIDKSVRAYIMGDYVALYKFDEKENRILIKRVVHGSILHGIFKI